MGEGARDLTELLHRAHGGDQEAWDALVARFGGLVWAISRAHRLSREDAADVVQTVWLRLVENLGRISDPERVGAWIATTARRECLRSIRRGGRELASDDLPEPAADPDPAGGLLRAERDRELWRAFGVLSDRCRSLLRLLMSDPPPSYAEVGAALDMPVGSIGPTRERCLARLRAALGAAEAGSGITGPTTPSYE